MPVAGPGVIRRRLSQAGAHRVEVDVNHAGQQVALGLDQRRSVAPFPQSAAAAMAVVEIAHIAAANGLHHPGHAVRCVGRNQQMKVIAHQHVSMNSDLTGLRLRLPQRQ